MSSPVPSESFTYYGDRYWNSIPMVEVELRRRAADRMHQSWGQKLLEWNGKSFNKAISLNCGNGWVERELVSTGVVGAAIGVDISHALLAEARAEAAKRELPIEYEQTDTNTAAFDYEGIDLVVNFAAMHHVARLDRVMRNFCRLLPESGAFMSWDYVGPHRNQYPVEQWNAISQLNETLPVEMRKRLQYPHIHTMLRDDPTEAIHSELILPIMRRYFHLEHVRYLGGALAYELLCFNDAFFDGQDHTTLVQHLLDADAAYMTRSPEANTLFAYVLARPNKAALLDTEQLLRWEREEDDREAAAERNDGKYYADTPMALEYLSTNRRSFARRVAGRVKRQLQRVLH